MKRTTVYLSDEELDGLRALSAATGRSQADLIREGIRRVLTRRPKRAFHSMGAGAGRGDHPAHWHPDDLAQRRLGRNR